MDRRIRTMHSRRLGLLVSVAAFMSLVGPLGIGVAAAAGPVIVPTDPAAVTGGPGQGGIVQLSAADQALLVQKESLAQDYARVGAGQLDPAVFAAKMTAFTANHGAGSGPLSASGNVSPMVAVSGWLAMSQHAQTTNYYCGPASALSVIYYKAGSGASGPAGETLTQKNLAKSGAGYLYTDQDGATNWSRGAMAPALNTWAHVSWYLTVSGTGNYQGYLTFDIDYGWPLVVAQYEKGDGGATPHLVGHPTSFIIQHWIAVHGYGSSGAQTTYADSVAGASSISWSPNVPAHSTIASSSITTMISQGGYGYIW